MRSATIKDKDKLVEFSSDIHKNEGEEEPLGFIQHSKEMWGPNILLWGNEPKPGVSYLSVTLSVIRNLEKRGQEFAEKKER